MNIIRIGFWYKRLFFVCILLCLWIGSSGVVFGQWDNCNNPTAADLAAQVDAQIAAMDWSYSDVGWTCTPSCGSCTLPPCPSGSNTTSRPNCAAPGTSCNRGDDGCGGRCGSLTRSCWWLENAPAPGAPEGIGFKMQDVTCDLGGEIRIPYPTFGLDDGFLAHGSTNLRDSDPIRGLAPALTYRYRLPQLGLTSSWLNTTTRYAPSMDVTGSEVYTIFAGARSQNRCSGFTTGPEISRTLKVNYVPRVVSIEPVGDSNGGVSGHMQYNGGENGFTCDVENPKTFLVTFRDNDGCGDLWESFPADTNICGGAKTPSLLAQAVDSTTGREFSDSVSPIAGSVRCEGGNLLVAEFSLEFLGVENVHLDIQAKAEDIVGESSDWQTRTSWSYDGNRPVLAIQSDMVVGVDELNVVWSAVDDNFSLSGVRGLRISSKLTEGDILKGESYYSPIIYDGREYELRDPFEADPFVAWVNVWEPDLLSASAAKLRTEASGIDLVDIGINQDGFLDFRLESVDRACNYAIPVESSVPLGSPWIATRGGFVHSGGDIKIAVKQSLYSDIIDSIYPSAGEVTSLSTELLTVGGENVLGFGVRDYVYDLLNYDKKLNHSWYDLLYRRAESRDPERTMWSVANVDANSEISDDDFVAKCTNEQHIYFVPGDLVVNPLVYEHFSPENTLAGCVFIVSDNVTIGAGEHKSAGIEDPEADDFRPEYDLVKGYFIVDGHINIKFVDENEEVRDGLKVVGGLFATGTGTDPEGDSSSIILGRSLQLRNNLLFPTLIVFHDSRYLEVGREVLGDSFGGSYVTDIGLKE